LKFNKNDEDLIDGLVSEFSTPRNKSELRTYTRIVLDRVKDEQRLHLLCKLRLHKWFTEGIETYERTTYCLRCGRFKYGH